MPRSRSKSKLPSPWAAEMAQKMNISPVPYITPFRERVYKLLLTVKPGTVTTYKHMAERLQCRSCQAVGQALKNNPFAPMVPCHRVVSASLSIGGFAGFTDPASAKIRKKVRLLKEEGVAFEQATKSSGWKLSPAAAKKCVTSLQSSAASNTSTRKPAASAPRAKRKRDSREAADRNIKQKLQQPQSTAHATGRGSTSRRRE